MIVIGILNATYVKINESGWSMRPATLKKLNNGIKVEWTGIIIATINNPSTNPLSFHFIRVIAKVTKLPKITVSAVAVTVIHTLLKKYTSMFPAFHTFA